MADKISPELKEAIQALPIKEKDRLLIRLIPKAKNLVEQLEFKLLEHSETTEERRADVDDQITYLLNHYEGNAFHSKYVVSILRDVSGKINHHISITKDRYGEVELNLKMLNACFGFSNLQKGNLGRMIDEKFYEYVLKRLAKILKIAGALHSDYHLDFSEGLEDLYAKFDEYPEMCHFADRLMIPYEELEGGNIPDQYIKHK